MLRLKDLAEQLEGNAAWTNWSSLPPRQKLSWSITEERKGVQAEQLVLKT
jgi:hypothetical protein